MSIILFGPLVDVVAQVFHIPTKCAMIQIDIEERLHALAESCKIVLYPSSPHQFAIENDPVGLGNVLALHPVYQRQHDVGVIFDARGLHLCFAETGAQIAEVHAVADAFHPLPIVERVDFGADEGHGLDKPEESLYLVRILPYFNPSLIPH